MRAAERLARADLTLDLIAADRGLEAAAELAEKLPGLSVVVNHLGGVRIDGGPRRRGQDRPADVRGGDTPGGGIAGRRLQALGSLSRGAGKGPSGSLVIRVLVDVDRGPPEVATAYLTGKVGKYWK